MLEAQPSHTNEEDLPAVFWDEMPTNKDNADLAAINALIEEQTPEERAESHKVRAATARILQSTRLYRSQSRCFAEPRQRSSEDWPETQEKVLFPRSHGCLHQRVRHMLWQ